MRQNFCGSVAPAANFIFACPCKAIGVGVEATESCHTIRTSGAVEVLALIYPSVVLQKQVVGAFIWSPVLGILIWRRHYSLPIAAFAQKQDTHSFRSNTLKRDFRLNSFTVCEVVAGSFGILAAWTAMH